LGTAILGFVGGSHLAMDVVRGHREYAASLAPLDGPGFAARVMALSAAYDPAVVAVQLNLVGSHDAPRLRTVMGGDLAGVRLATLMQATLPGAPCIYYGDEIGMSGGNDPDCRGAFPWDEARWDSGLRESVQALLRLRTAEPALRDGPLRVAGASGAAVAFERGSGASRFVVTANAGDAPVTLALRFDDAPSGAGGHVAPIDLPGFGGVGEARIVDGASKIELAARSGAVLRVV
jgi:cyclomaltodextrinase / maltogenic alpha-amylase / neopullulanase